jgi:hypothetical protein
MTSSDAMNTRTDRSRSETPNAGVKAADRVRHSRYGDGTVRAVWSPHQVGVRFDATPGLVRIDPAELSRLIGGQTITLTEVGRALGVVADAATDALLGEGAAEAGRRRARRARLAEQAREALALAWTVALALLVLAFAAGATVGVWRWAW